MTSIFLASLLLGALAGLLAGLFGIGGGIIIVPVFAWLFEIAGFPAEKTMLLAIATSLATIIPTSIASSLAHHRRQNLIISWVKKLLPGIVAGSFMMTVVAPHLSAALLRNLFILYLLYVATTLFLQKKPVFWVENPWPGMDFMAAMIIGGLSTLLGIGGGTLNVPYLLGRNLEMKNAVAVSSACGLPIAITGSLGYILAGWNQPDLPSYSSGYIYWPAFLGVTLTSIFTASVGAKIASHLPAQHLKRYFALLLYLIAAKMLW
jgi:uncharacterized membrane protein YfcA